MLIILKSFVANMYLCILIVGGGDLIPVMGFFCQRCEEFFSDLNSAERHVESHSRKDKNKVTR